MQMLNSELLLWFMFVMLKWIVEGLKNLTDTAFWTAYICWTSEENLICFSWEEFFEMVSLVFSWGEVFGVWHSVTTERRIDTTAASTSE